MRTFNALAPEVAAEALLAVCESRVWAERVLAARPYPSLEAVLAEADRALAALSEREFARALAGHPRIGDPTGNAVSRDEQSAVAQADPRTLDELAYLNRLYEERHEQVYLVYATGRTAQELLAVLAARVGNDTATERAAARRELAQINRNRLRRLLGPEYPPDHLGVDAP